MNNDHNYVILSILHCLACVIMLHRRLSFCVFVYFTLFLFVYVRMFVVQQIPESNLLMLVVQADCDCSKQYPPITLEPEEVRYIL